MQDLEPKYDRVTSRYRDLGSDEDRVKHQNKMSPLFEIMKILQERKSAITSGYHSIPIKIELSLG